MIQMDFLLSMQPSNSDIDALFCDFFRRLRNDRLNRSTIFFRRHDEACLLPFVATRLVSIEK